MKRFLLIYDSDYYKIVEDDCLFLFSNDLKPLVIIELTDELISAIIGDKDE